MTSRRAAGKSPDPSSVRSILLIKLRAIGDVILSTAVIPDLAGAYPDAAIDFLTEAPAAGVVEGLPGIRSVIVFRKGESSAALISRVRRNRYDLVIDLFGNPRSAIVTLFSGAAVRVGYRFNWRAFCYNRVVEPRGGEVHNIEFNLDALRSLGIEPANRRPVVVRDSASEAFAADFIGSIPAGPLVALNPGGGWISKKWRPRHYTALGRLLRNEYGAGILVLWGPGERETALEIQSGIGEGATIAPPTDLKQLGAILRRCRVLVTNDSGPMHLAAALNVPVVAIFGPTDPNLQGPSGTESAVVRHGGLACLNCNLTVCPIGNPCMEELMPEEVFASFKTLYAAIERPKKGQHIR